LYFLIASFWWKASERPFPSMLELGKAMGMHVRNITRSREMEAVGFLPHLQAEKPVRGNKSQRVRLDATHQGSDQVGA